MTEPREPHEIARRTFNMARRGYEPQEVRGFLHEVSALLERLQRSEQELRDRAQRAEARLGDDHQPDEAVLLEVLGEETTRVLTSAREAASEIRAKAEEAAARIIAEATAEAAEIRGSAVRESDALMAETKREHEATLEQARTELERRSAEAEEAAARIRAAGEAAAQRLREEGQAELAAARAEGEAAVEAARQEGRVMVAEAQAVRERILRDLAVRRKRARQQVEKLNAGRERLLEAYEVVRRTVGEATDELTTALSDARLAADAAARRIDEEAEPTLEQLDEEVANAGLVDLPIAVVDHEPELDHDHDDDTPGPFSGEVPVVEVTAASAPGEPPAGEAPPPRSLELDERRGRKRRKRGGFEGLPPGELTVVEPPSDDEGVRILAEPADAATMTEPEPPSDDEGVRVQAEPAGDAAPAEAPEPAADETGAGPQPAVDAGASPDGTAAGDDAAGAGIGTAGEDTTVDVAAVGVVSVEAPAGEDEAAGPAGKGDATEAAGPAPEEAGTPPAEGEGAVAAEGGPGEPASEEQPTEAVGEVSSADELFARLRAEQAAGEAPSGDVAAPEPEPEADAEAEAEHGVEPEGDDLARPVDAAIRPFAARRAALESVEKDLARRLKRSLADEQNEVLDLLRRAKPRGVDDLLPGVDEHAARWADVVTASLSDAAAAGADWSGGTPSSVADLADELARNLTVPLRERIERSFSASDGNLDDVADRVRALYREWKGQRLAETCADFAGAAYARGVFDGVPAGAQVHWVVDPAAGACPDCDDNVLAGAIAKGAEFPTGNPCAPAHPGCHCLVLAVES